MAFSRKDVTLRKGQPKSDFGSKSDFKIQRKGVIGSWEQNVTNGQADWVYQAHLVSGKAKVPSKTFNICNYAFLTFEKRLHFFVI